MSDDLAHGMDVKNLTQSTNIPKLGYNLQYTRVSVAIFSWVYICKMNLQRPRCMTF